MMKDFVSIEKVLNSRCSSSSGLRKSHFGTFTYKNPPEAVIASIHKCLVIPRFSRGKLLQWFKNGYLFLGFENAKDPYTQRLLHIESGMQHEATYLACVAEGVGTCIHNQGINGTQIGDRLITAKHPIMQIIDPYDSGKFTSKAPGPQKPYIPGRNLTEPIRESDVECSSELSRLTKSRKSGSSATEKDKSQLLWAAKGRTPHCIKMHRWKFMWGLTIPTWGGVQNFTSVYLLKNKKLYNYVNWTKEFSLMNRIFREKFGWTRGNPTHDIRFIRNTDIISQTDGHEEAIILCQNEYTGRALWEIGYMLENMFLQAKSLGISYASKIFNSDEVQRIENEGIRGIVAAFILQ